MWLIFNKIFGWDYVVIQSRCLSYRYIRRLKKSPANDMYITFVPGDLWFLNEDNTTDNGYIWKALTWSDNG